MRHSFTASPVRSWTLSLQDPLAKGTGKDGDFVTENGWGKNRELEKGYRMCFVYVAVVWPGPVWAVRHRDSEKCGG